MLRFPLEKYDLSPKSNGKIGKGYIFNNYAFTTKLKALSGFPQHLIKQTELKREGSKRDVETLKELFELMKLEIKVYSDCTKQDFKSKLKHIADEEITEDDKCVVVAIMTHGSEKQILLKDKAYELDKAFKTINDCENLKDKPKLFFIQACRGRIKDENWTNCDAMPFFESQGIHISLIPHFSNPQFNPTSPEDSRNEEVPEIESVFQLTPKESDILACYATANGYVSFRNKTDGARFIQTMGKELKTYFQGQYMEEDFANLMTKVSGEVAKHPSLEEKEIDGQKMRMVMTQMPTCVSSLRKQLVFPSVGVATARSDIYD